MFAVTCAESAYIPAGVAAGSWLPALWNAPLAPFAYSASDGKTGALALCDAGT